ncbi:MAG TPA: polyamine aminopropyltransferase [Planctomycetaceae bacterium]|nr:polyamine aminopropyltransferase [Planctomycetaceae bacterium]
MNRAPFFLLYLNVLVVATCGLVYELLAGTLASYVLGDSVTQFSLIIGVYLSALGIGAWLSRFIDEGLARSFIEIELGVALVGGASAPVLFLSFAYLSWFRLALFGIVLVIGTLVGLELPLLMRILKDHLDFRDLVSRVLAFDYLGALLASLLFPIFFVPRLGLVRTSLLFGMCNAAVGLWGTYLLRPLLVQRGLFALRARAWLVMVLLAIALFKADALTMLAEEGTLPHTIVYTKSSPYQRIVITKGQGGFQLYLNGNLQFNSIDEYRYHEALVHPALTAAHSPRRVLVLGGGDGLAVREILRHASVESVTLVDLDPEMTSLSERFEPLARLNGGSLADPRVKVINQDAFLWVQEPGSTFDAAIVDFPDPGTFSIGKLYTTRFFRLLKSRMAPAGAIAVQCTSPLVAPQAYWCIIRTLEAAGFSVHPYHVTVPAFGIWGFALATVQPAPVPTEVPAAVAPHLRFLDRAALAAIFDFPLDLHRVETEVNRLDNQALVRYYDAEWRKWD